MTQWALAAPATLDRLEEMSRGRARRPDDHRLHRHEPAPRNSVSSPLALRGERSPMDMVTAVLIDAKLELVDERRIAQSEVMT